MIISEASTDPLCAVLFGGRAVKKRRNALLFDRRAVLLLTARALALELGALDEGIEQRQYLALLLRVELFDLLQAAGEAGIGRFGFARRPDTQPVRRPGQSKIGNFLQTKTGTETGTGTVKNCTEDRKTGTVKNRKFPTKSRALFRCS